MAISLIKGQTINLDKEKNDLSSITVGLGWKVKEKDFLSKLSADGEFDLDAVAFLLDESGKVSNVGDDRLEGGDVVFFNNLKHRSGAIVHSGDNLVGGEGVEDDEQIVVKLNDLRPEYHRILFLVSIYRGKSKDQHFGDIEQAFMRAVDNKGVEIARYNLSDDESRQDTRTLVFGEVYRRGDGWKFRALGEGYETDSFVSLLKKKYI
ncbi:TerD family protein [Singulisphaera sp. PoT]|uniref:TerD family protein n=1 Tax=Singulisphaera sp. PoT TaxID=3411797 RepID=UPI003BF60618